jgi:hypothetical protein
LSGLPSAAGSASSAAAGRIASISQAPSGNARYVLVADSSSTSTQRGWRLQHQSLQGSVFAERNLPTTSDVLWRRASGTGVPLPTSAWVRQCGANVYTVQDGYRVQVTAWDPQLIDGWQSEINLGEPARVTVLTMVECDGVAESSVRRVRSRCRRSARARPTSCGASVGRTGMPPALEEFVAD